MRQTETDSKTLLHSASEIEKDDPALESAQAARFLGLTLGTFYNYRSEGKITPDFLYCGRPRYRESTLVRWKAENTVVLSALGSAPAPTEV